MYKPMTDFFNRSNKALDYCHAKGCIKAIYNEKVIKFSKKKYGVAVCYNCQQKEDLKVEGGEKI